MYDSALIGVRMGIEVGGTVGIGRMEQDDDRGDGEREDVDQDVEFRSRERKKEADSDGGTPPLPAPTGGQSVPVTGSCPDGYTRQ